MMYIGDLIILAQIIALTSLAIIIMIVKDMNDKTPLYLMFAVSLFINAMIYIILWVVGYM